MRRTYASKKGTGGGLDHKDLILTVDEKTSVFDAYYIRNIKQTKRELSSIVSSNQYGAVSKKVRKRKYVKRIVKDPEPTLRESLSRSVFLTPDKSIHVKKEFDPFDMLLNSSTANIDVPDKSNNVRKELDTFDMLLNSSVANTGEPEANKSNLFECLQPKREDKRCLRRKIVKPKKFSYSSEESTDSNKENSVHRHNTTSNTSDIMSHKLVIEKETNSSPKILDESINNIFTNIAVLNSRNSSYGGLRTSFKFRRNRLTASNQSPILQKSPLSSTPFKAKYRGESIFKFSPINHKEDCSPCFVTVVEDQDNADGEKTDRSDLHSPKPLLPHSNETQKCVKRSKSVVNVIENIETDNCYPYSPGKMEILQNFEPIVENSLKIQSDVNETSNYNITHSTELNSLQTTEIEPFMGFSDNLDNNDVKEISVDHQDETNKNKMDISKHPSILKYTSDECYIDEPEISLTESSKKDIDQSHLTEINSQFKESVLAHCDNSEIGEIYENNSGHKDTDSRSSDVGSATNNSLIGIDDETYDISSLSSEDEERESLYNTCSSERSVEEIQCLGKEPLVVIERMNDSLFLKYYQDNTECEYDNDDNLETSIQSVMSDDYASIESETDDNASWDDSREHIENEAIDSTDNIISSNDDSNSEDKCISFVTTRKRNEVTNNSVISIFNNSYTSTSTDCEKTVLSNTETTLEKSDLEIYNDNLDPNNLNQLHRKNFEEDTFEEYQEKDANNSNELSMSNELDGGIKLKNPDSGQEIQNNSITIRNTSKGIESLTSPERSNVPDCKPTIVLQPGKKWERSLSIYRRMTMMNDHFDHSILEEEPMDSKGRKYRQSVLSTMELQEFKGPLHNESINNRRSTFVSKPNRSTIRILKDTDNSRISLCTTAIFDDLKGFLTDECDDTLIDLSKLSIADAGNEVTVLDLHDTSTHRITTARDYVLRRCNQTDAINFDECYPDSVLKNCHKIGEGVYGEVFLWRARDGRARVMKIVPVAGDVKVNGEHQKDFHEIISEIVIAMELSALHTPIADIERHLDEGKDIDALDLQTIQNATDVFNEVLAIRCVYGSYPSRLLDLWDLYDECKGSENDNPAILPLEQQYIVLELANAGLDLESYQFNNAEQAHALFLQVALALAVGEEAFQFEHRDLHWGNVLIAPTEQKYATFVLRGRSWRVARCGVAATIIDYSLSRLSAPLLNAERAALYNDLSTDDSLFDAVGDYQFQVYRLMRDKLRNDWKNFEPYTNILWLHYTVDKMVTALRYKRTNTKIHKHYIEKLKAIKNRILEYGSAVQFVLTDNEF